MFGSKQVSAVGVSLGIERVFVIKEQQLKDQNQVIRPNKTDVLVSILGNDVTLAGELVGELWDAGVKAEFLVNKRRQKHFDHAKDSKIPWMILVGEKEIKDGTVQLKHLEAGSDVKYDIPRETFVEELRKRDIARQRKLRESASHGGSITRTVDSKLHFVFHLCAFELKEL
ncbi:histidine-tRNA ligase-like protein, partial [Trifolium pratense]